jgi:ferric-dicitrate binding protein FerR (iron transport regulator)
MSKKIFTAMLGLGAAIVLSLASACGGHSERTASAAEQDLVAGRLSLTCEQALVLYAAGEVTASGAAGAAVATEASGAGGSPLPANGGSAVQAGDFLGPGQTIATGPDSTCDLQFGDRAVVRVDEKTEVRLDDLLLKPGEARVGLRVAAGTLLCKVEKLSAGERFRVISRTAVCGVRGTEFGVTVAADQTTVLAVKEGLVSFRPPALDPDELAKEAASGDPEVVASLKGLEEGERVVAADEEADLSPAAAAKAEEDVRAFRGDLKRYAEKKLLTEPEKAEFKARLLKFKNDLSREVKAPRRMESDRRERLKRLDELRRRRIQAVPQPETVKSPVPARPRDEAPPAAARDGTPPPTGREERSESLMRIQVSVEPATAAILFNGRPAGRGRFQGLFPVGESLSFQFTHPGYEPQSLYVDVYPEAAKVYKVTLNRIDPARLREPRPAPGAVSPPPDKRPLRPRKPPVTPRQNPDKGD